MAKAKIVFGCYLNLPMFELVLERLVNHFQVFLIGSLVGLLGFTLVGMLYAGVARRRSGRSVSARVLLADVFPRQMYSGPTARMDMLNYLPTNLLVRPALDVIVLILVIAVGGELATLFAAALRHGFGPALVLSLPVSWLVLVQVVFTFLGSEFGFYIFHRLEHENPMLWRIHAVHHSAEKLNFFTSNRDHPVETVLITFAKIIGVGLFLGLALYLGGLRLLPQTFFYAGVYSVCIHGFYAGHSHSHLPISFGPVLNVLIGGPVMHQIHHSAEDHMFNKNYGMATNVYDWLFGTLYMPRAGEIYRWGLNDHDYGVRNPHQTIKDFYLKPILETVATARAGIRNLLQRWI